MSEPAIRTIAPEEHHAASRLLEHLNPDKDFALIAARLQRILADHPHYTPVGAFMDGQMVGFVGVWVATRIWCGRYLEADNFIVHPDHRSGGIGTKLMAHLETMARESGCEVIALDTYTSLHAAHRLYHRLGYEIVGFHFIKSLKPA